MTTVPVDLHRELSKQQKASKELSIFWVTVCGVAMFLVLFGFYFLLPQL